MEYSQKTQDKIDMLCRLADRKSYKLQKKKAEEKLLQTYDLFDLPRPKKIKWHNKITEGFLSRAYRASRAYSASSASSVYSAYSAYSASSAYRASSASSASSAYSAYRAYRASRASSDYDFDWGILVFEYFQNPEFEKPNEDDKKFLKYFELMIQAKSCGAGAFCDYEDTLHIVTCPIIRCNKQGQYHSLTHPAISWEGEKLYCIDGVQFGKEWWDKIRKDKMTANEVFAIDNIEHRRIAYEYMDKKKLKDLKDFKVLDEKIDSKGNQMKVISFNIQNMDEDLIFYNCICPTTGREYFVQTKQKTCDKAKTMSWGLEEADFVDEW